MGMKILLTNDDGIFAPGIAALYGALAEVAEVTVVAPAETQTAASHSVSVSKPMAVRRVRAGTAFEGWAGSSRWTSGPTSWSAG